MANQQPMIRREGNKVRSLSWTEKQKVEADICLLFHQLADYDYIMGDLYYGDVFGLPYWEYLDISGLEREDAEFIRDGCLVMLLAMAWGVIDGSCEYIVDHLQVCRRDVARLAPQDEDTLRLVRTVQTALDVAWQIHGSSRRSALDASTLGHESCWAHCRYVGGYFRETAAQFKSAG